VGQGTCDKGFGGPWKGYKVAKGPEVAPVEKGYGGRSRDGGETVMAGLLEGPTRSNHDQRDRAIHVARGSYSIGTLLQTI
jgi:hypothetical protein